MAETGGALSAVTSIRTIRMSLFDSPISFAARSSHQMGLSSAGSSFSTQAVLVKSMETPMLQPNVAKTPVGHLVLLVFEAVLEVVCVSLPGYIVARQGMFDSESQKFLANLNVCLFTPCLSMRQLLLLLQRRCFEADSRPVEYWLTNFPI